MRYNDQTVRGINIKQRNISEEQFKNMDMPLLYPLGNSTSKAKYNDSQQLKQYLSERHHAFYENLSNDREAKDYVLASGESGNDW